MNNKEIVISAPRAMSLSTGGDVRSIYTVLESSFTRAMTFAVNNDLILSLRPFEYNKIKINDDVYDSNNIPMDGKYRLLCTALNYLDAFNIELLIPDNQSIEDEATLTLMFIYAMNMILSKDANILESSIMTAHEIINSTGYYPGNLRTLLGSAYGSLSLWTFHNCLDWHYSLPLLQETDIIRTNKRYGAFDGIKIDDSDVLQKYQSNIALITSKYYLSDNNFNVNDLFFTNDNRQEWINTFKDIKDAFVNICKYSYDVNKIQNISKLYLNTTRNPLYDYLYNMSVKRHFSIFPCRNNTVALLFPSEEIKLDILDDIVDDTQYTGINKNINNLRSEYIDVNKHPILNTIGINIIYTNLTIDDIYSQ